MFQDVYGKKITGGAKSCNLRYAIILQIRLMKIIVNQLVGAGGITLDGAVLKMEDLVQER